MNLRETLIAAGGLFLAPVVFQSSSGPGESDVRLLLPGAKEIAPEPRMLTAEEISQVEVSLGGKFAEAGKPISIFRLKGAPPDGGSEEDLRLAFVSVEGMKDAWLGVAANAKGEAAVVQIVSGGSVNKAWGPFLAQFSGAFGVRLTSNSALSPARLAELQKKAASNNEEGKKLQALLTQKQLMWENAAQNDLLYEQVRARGDKAAAAAKDYAKLLGELSAFAPKMSVWLEPADLKVYQEHFQSMKKSADALAAGLGKGSFEDANKHMRAINNRCGKCHGWDGSRFGKPLEGAMIRLREELGIGKGYFVLGHDVQLHGAVKKEEAQAVATAVKKALWILKFSFEGS